MSRKNKNGYRASYQPKNYGADFLQPTLVDRVLAQGSTSEKRAPVSGTGLVRCDEKSSYEYLRLPCGWLKTDFSYQRPIDEQRVERIVADFDPRLVNTLKVSNRDGKFYVFDGAHTLAALKRVHGNEDFLVDCKVFRGLTYEDEAYLFALQTGESKAVAFSIRLKALLISDSREAVDFRTHTANAGLHLSESGTSATTYTIAALAKAYKLYEECGAEQYEEILRLIVDTWGGAAWSLTGYILGGVAVFVREYGDSFKRDRFVKRLRGVTYEQLRDEARRQRRGSSDIAHALAMAKYYNATGGRGTVDPRLLTMKD